MKDHSVANPGRSENDGKAAFPGLTMEANFEDEGPDLVGYWRMAKRQKGNILGITILSVIIGVLSAFYIRPIYKAETTLQINPFQPDIGLSGQRVETPLIALFYETQHEIIHSRRVAELVVDKLDLVGRQQANPDPAESNNIDDHNAPSDLFSKALHAIQQWINWRTWIPEKWHTKPDTEALRNQLIDEIQDGLIVSQAKQSEIIKLSYQSPNPKLAATIANAVADAYIEFGLTSRLSGVKDNASWLSSQLDEMRTKIKASEEALQAYQREVGIVDTVNQQRLASERLSRLTAELLKVQTTRIDAQIRSNQARNLKGSSEANASSLSEVLKSPSVRKLSEAENGLARKVQELSKRYGEKHPKMISARSDLQEARRSLQREIDKVVDSIRKEYDFAVTQEQEIHSLIEEQKKEISDLSNASFELALLEREVENERKLYESFLDKFKAAGVAEDYDASNVRVVDPATVPWKPFKPNKLALILIAGILGLIGGILIALLRERLDNTFKTAEHIEEKLGIPSLGITPMVYSADNGESVERQVLDSPHSSFAENINFIRSALLFSNRNKPPKTLLTTSATSAEGKTVLSINLAAAFSQLDRTLLLDLDLRKSNISTLLGIETKPGLTDVIGSEAPLSEAVSCLGPDEQLFVLPCGSAPHNPLQLLTSSGFHALLDELKQEFTYIVMDAPPILAVSDATVLGHLADSIIVAVKAESTTHEMLAETLSRLRKSGVDATGAVLCQAEPRRMAEYASYYDANYAHYYAYNSDKVAAADHAMEAITGVATARDSQPDLAAEGDTGHGRRPFAQKAERQGTDRNERPFGQKAG